MKTDLERHIRESYSLICQYQDIIKTSSDPKEKARAQIIINEQWALINGYLEEYRRLAGDAFATDIGQIAAHFDQEDNETQVVSSATPQAGKNKDKDNEEKGMSAKQARNNGGIIAWFANLPPEQKVAIIVAIIGLVGTLGAALMKVGPQIFSPSTPTITAVPTSFSYQVRVQARSTGEYVQGAKVIVEIGGKAPLDDITDSNGLARIIVPSSYARQAGRLRVEATGYKIYDQHIDLAKGGLPEVVQLEPAP